MSEVDSLNKFIFILTRFLRTVTIALCILVIVAYGFIMDSMCDSGDLTLVGKAFAVISSFGYMLVMFALLLVSVGFKWTMKYVGVLDPWPVRCGVQMFMGTQILISKAAFDAGLDSSTLQDLVLTITGWAMIVTGAIFGLLGVFGARQYDHYGTGKQEVEPAYSTSSHKEFKSGPAAGASEALIQDDDFSAPPPQPAPQATPSQSVEAAGGFRADDPHPYARKTVAAEAVPAYSPPPAGQAPEVESDPYGGAADPFASRAAASRDDDIAARRQAEDDELERLYAQQASQAKAAGQFTAAD